MRSDSSPGLTLGLRTDRSTGLGVPPRPSPRVGGRPERRESSCRPPPPRPAHRQWANPRRGTADKRRAGPPCYGTASPCTPRGKEPEERRSAWSNDSLRHLDTAVIRFIDELRRILLEA